jgi:hypothetical protein
VRLIAGDGYDQATLSALLGLRKTGGAPIRRYAWWSCPPFPKDRRLRLVDLPVEEIIISRPRVNFYPANLAAEAAGMLARMLFPRRGVRQPAVGTAKEFGCPYVACHIAIMRRIEHSFQRGSLR